MQLSVYVLGREVATLEQAWEWTAGDALTDFSPPPKQKTEPTKIGRSPLLGQR